MSKTGQEKRDIAEVIEQYRLGFATFNAATLATIWDQDYDNIIYVPLEAIHPLRGWNAVEQYYQSVTGFLRAKVMTVDDLSVDVLGDVAYAFCNFHFEGEINGESHIADGRNTFILRRRNGAWKVIHYHESRPGFLELDDQS